MSMAPYGLHIAVLGRLQLSERVPNVHLEL